MGKKSIIFLLFVFCLLGQATAQERQFALKTNILGDALANITLGAELQTGEDLSIDLSGSFNAWKFDGGTRWKHWLLQPEVRKWFCDPFAGHFLGMHLIGMQYNIGGFNGGINMLGTDLRKLEDMRYQGWGVGAGISYGYAWLLSRHWNLEAEIGIGWIYTRYDSYPCANCGNKVDKNRAHNYIGPTKAALNLVYEF